MHAHAQSSITREHNGRWKASLSARLNDIFSGDRVTMVGSLMLTSGWLTLSYSAQGDLSQWPPCISLSCLLGTDQTLINTIHAGYYLRNQYGPGAIVKTTNKSDCKCDRFFTVITAAGNVPRSSFRVSYLRSDSIRRCLSFLLSLNGRRTTSARTVVEMCFFRLQRFPEKTPFSLQVTDGLVILSEGNYADRIE